MKSQRILDCLGGIQSDYVLAAAPEAAAPQKKRPTRRLWWLAAAACLTLALAGAAVYAWRMPHAPAALPQLEISPFTGGYGFEGYIAYDISELARPQPLPAAKAPATLPVYRNILQYDEYHIPHGTDFAAMEAMLRRAAVALGLDGESLVITDDAPDEAYKEMVLEKAGGEVPAGYFDPTHLMAEAAGVQLEIDETYTLTICFDTPRFLPEGYTCQDEDADLADVEAAAAWLAENYAELLDMRRPTVGITGGDRNIYGTQHYTIEVYEGAGDSVQQLVRSHFDRAVFYGNADGALYMIRLFKADLSDKVGDYPIITLADAQAMLAEGRYITTAPYDMPGLEYVAAAELTYRNGPQEAYYMPYYRFYVQIPEAEMEGGMHTYAAYYVPAVQPEYLAGWTGWDGGFTG